MQLRRSTVFFLLLVFISCKQGKKYHDVIEKQNPIVKSDKLAGILEFQKKINAEFKNPEQSPLPDRFRIHFETLDFFPPDTNYIVTAALVRTPDALPFLMPTTTGTNSEEVVYGVLTFELKGKEHSLEIYQNPELMNQEGFEDYLFLPFTDLTNGNETYGGGRYLDLRIPTTNSITLDFNRAYNPYCAYNKKFSCPLVPSVNHLDIAINAGLKDFKKK